MALLALPLRGAAQVTFPARPVRIVVPFAPGGGNDTFARQLGPRLAEAWKQSVIIENRAGAGGNIGTAEVVKSPPDGHTLLLGHSGTLAINPPLYGNLPFDVQRDLQPVVMFASSPLVLVVPADSSAQTVVELVALAKSKPGALSYGSGGAGTGAHLTGEMFASRIGAVSVHVPYKGTVPALTDVAAGHLQFMFSVTPSAITFLKGGRVRALAVTGLRRLPTLPEVPTMIEAGLADFESSLTYGILAPRGVPEGVVREIRKQVLAAAALPEFQERLASEGALATHGGAAEFGALIRAETLKWTAVIKVSGAKAQ
jgi:tripartite-type tricarboxylate transporter receptor subunit TctC